jgi:hypothetical protein
MNDKKMKEAKHRFILLGIKNTLICDGIAILGLSIIGTLLGLIKHTAISRSIPMALYFGGALVLIVSVPQFYRRRKQNAGMQTGGMLFGFYGWFGSNSESESSSSDKDYQLYQNDGFWLGIMLFLGGMILLIVGAGIENLFFGK